MVPKIPRPPLIGYIQKVLGQLIDPNRISLDRRMVRCSTVVLIHRRSLTAFRAVFQLKLVDGLLLLFEHLRLSAVIAEMTRPNPGKAEPDLNKAIVDRIRYLMEQGATMKATDLNLPVLEMRDGMVVCNLTFDFGDKWSAQFVNIESESKASAV